MVRGGIVVTAGDPSGIGPEVAVKALKDRPHRSRAVLIGEASSLADAVRRFAPRLDVEVVALDGFSGVSAGEVSAVGGAAAIAGIDEAVAMIEAGRADAIVTGPMGRAGTGRCSFSRAKRSARSLDWSRRTSRRQAAAG